MERVGKPQVLFVDGDPHVLRVFGRIFRREAASWELRFAPSGDAALVMLDQFQFDLVVCDLDMPGINGVALLAIVKRRTPRAVRVLHTASVVDPASIDVDVVLDKLCDQSVLRETICGLLSAAG